MGDPFCDRTRGVLSRAAGSLGVGFHPRGTVVTIEGPRFSTRAESNLFRMWGCDLVNMTTVPEATLAKELGLCYASIALPTDYDCWKGESVSVSLPLCQRVPSFLREAHTNAYAPHTHTHTHKCLRTTHTHAQGHTHTHTHTHTHQVSVEMVMEQMKRSSELALRLVTESVSLISQEDWTDTITLARVRHHTLENTSSILLNFLGTIYTCMSSS